MLRISKSIHAGGRELQDRAEVIQHGSFTVLVVADGAGGIGGGAEAAEFAVQRMRGLVINSNLDAKSLCQLLAQIDQEMAAAGSYGETTCVVVAVTDAGIAGASVGDSGAWIISGSGADNLTAGQHRKPFIGTGRASPVGFNRGLLRDTLMLASDGLLKYASPEHIALASQDRDLNQALANLVSLVRYHSGTLPDDIAIILARNG